MHSTWTSLILPHSIYDRKPKRRIELQFRWLAGERIGETDQHRRVSLMISVSRFGSRILLGFGFEGLVASGSDGSHDFTKPSSGELETVLLRDRCEVRFEELASDDRLEFESEDLSWRRSELSVKVVGSLREKRRTRKERVSVASSNGEQVREQRGREGRTARAERACLLLTRFDRRTLAPPGVTRGKRSWMSSVVIRVSNASPRCC